MRINGAGCALIDNLYNNVSFTEHPFVSYRSHYDGDGGVIVGGLVFAEDLAEFARKPYDAILTDITGKPMPDSRNLGGPAIIPVVHAAQLLFGSGVETAYFGIRGDDEGADCIEQLLRDVPVDLSAYHRVSGPTPATDVLSDPAFDAGRGERSFINRIGVAGNSSATEFDESFFRGDIVFFGGTALVPPQHDRLSSLTRRAAERGAFVVVSTVFDFRNHKRSPHKQWPLVEDYSVVDLVVTDREESRRITDEEDPCRAADWFIARGAGAAVVTQGSGDVIIRRGSSRFDAPVVDHVPVSEAVGEQLRVATLPHDTTGCGDNFVGGMLAAIATQLERRTGPVDLVAAAACGVVSGGFAATYLGGLYRESVPGEKRHAIARLWTLYRQQVAGSVDLPPDLPVAP